MLSVSQSIKVMGGFHRFVNERMEDDEYYFGPPPFVSFYPFIFFSICNVWNNGFLTTLFFRAILTILQIPSAARDPVTRYAALLSLICALTSLLYGCIYIIRFGMMRSTCRAAEWALVSCCSQKCDYGTLLTIFLSRKPRRRRQAFFGMSGCF